MFYMSLVLYYEPKNNIVPVIFFLWCLQRHSVKCRWLAKWLKQVYISLANDRMSCFIGNWQQTEVNSQHESITSKYNHIYEYNKQLAWRTGVPSQRTLTMFVGVVTPSLPTPHNGVSQLPQT